MIEIIDCEQNAPEWYAARCGIVTASQLKAVMANGRNGEASKTRRTYMLRLAGEIITGTPAETFRNSHMERGHQLEEEARNFYAFKKNCDPLKVGFIKNGRRGCSPDALIQTDGMLEIKTALPEILLDHILKDRLPPEHKTQIQGQLWISERAWCDLLIYWPGLPPFIYRENRDDDYIADLANAVDVFNAELDEIVSKISSHV